MKILIRADASAEIGTGHVVRTHTLAQALRGKGADVLFVCRPHAGNMISALRTDGFDVRQLPEVGSFTSPRLYERWIGATQETDAAQTIDAAGSAPIDWIIVDHYGLGLPWETELRNLGERVMVIDDLANRDHDCDLLLDQNYRPASSSPYEGRVQGTPELLLGPSYALLKPEYAGMRQSGLGRSEKISRILVFFGGGDNRELLGITMEALAVVQLEHLQVDVVIGQKAEHEVVDWQRQRLGRVTVHHALPHLAGLMASSHIAIGAGGSTTWERMCLGLPSLVVSTAENQYQACEALAQDGLVAYLGPRHQVSATRIAAELTALIEHPGKYKSMSERASRLVDGEGSQRVIKTMIG